MSYFLARQVAPTHLNPEGLKPIDRTIYATKKAAATVAWGIGIMGKYSPIVMDADHEPGRTILRTQAGP